MRHASVVHTERIEHLLDTDPPRVHLIRGDLSDWSSILRVLETSKPHEVYNLAAQSHVHVSLRRSGAHTVTSPGSGTTQTPRSHPRCSGSAARFYQASSFGDVRQLVEPPQDETTPFCPRAPTASAKVYAY